MTAPYRGVSSLERLEAQTREGLLQLEVAPRHVSLEIEGRLSIAVHDNFLTWIDLRDSEAENRRWWRRRRKPKKRSIRLDDGRLLVARAHLHEDLALWFEERPGIYRRLVGIEPMPLLDAAALQAWRDLEKLGKRLWVVLKEYGREAVAATEFGRGQHRALLVDYPPYSEVCARPVFRERHRPVFRVYRDGQVVNLKGKGQRGRCVSRYSVTIGADRVRFDQVDGTRAAELHLPWISPQDREELAVRFKTMIDGAGARMRAETEAEHGAAGDEGVDEPEGSPPAAGEVATTV